MFVWVEALGPSQQFFSHVGTEPPLPGYYQYIFGRYMYSTVQVFFHQPAHPRGQFFLSPPPPPPPADPRTCPLSIPPRDTLIPPRIRRGPAVVPPDTCLISPRIYGGLTMSNDDVIMIDSSDKIDLVIFYMYMYANDNSADQHALLCSPTIAIRDICLNAYFHFYFRSC